MPYGDGTGPMGYGPMTGRAAGYCAGYNVPGYMNPTPGRSWGFWGRGFWPGYGFGLGRGRGRGGGRGRGRGFRWRTFGMALPVWTAPVYPAYSGMSYARGW
jgi:hypothetical protein